MASPAKRAEVAGFVVVLLYLQKLLRRAVQIDADIAGLRMLPCFTADGEKEECSLGLLPGSPESERETCGDVAGKGFCYLLCSGHQAGLVDAVLFHIVLLLFAWGRSPCFMF